MNLPLWPYPSLSVVAEFADCRETCRYISKICFVTFQVQQCLLGIIVISSWRIASSSFRTAATSYMINFWEFFNHLGSSLPFRLMRRLGFQKESLLSQGARRLESPSIQDRTRQLLSVTLPNHPSLHPRR